MKQLFHRLVSWFRSWFVKPTPVIEVPTSPAQIEPETFKPTKAYADQRQKMPHNRRRKPSKAMRNLYKLT